MGSVKSFCVRVGEPGTARVGLCGTKSVLAGGGFVRTPAPKHTGLMYKLLHTAKVWAWMCLFYNLQTMQPVSHAVHAILKP